MPLEELTGTQYYATFRKLVRLKKGRRLSSLEVHKRHRTMNKNINHNFIHENDNVTFN